MKIRKKTKHFKKLAKPLPVETHGLPNNLLELVTKILRLDMLDLIIKNGN